MESSTRMQVLFKKLRGILLLLILGVAFHATGLNSQIRAQEIDIPFFEKHIRPLLVEHCYECHAADSKKLQAGLRLDHLSLLVQGGDSGPSIVPGKPEEGTLLPALRYESFEMPPSGKLSEEKVELFRKWIEGGAPWPDEAVPTVENKKEEFDLQARLASHWCWQKIVRPMIPADPWNGATPIDRFINKQLRDVDLKPNGEAPPNTLLRRIYIDLTGIPPTSEQIDEYLNDARPDRFSKLVDKLLASPQFGVRFSRHWLDLVRYAESRGHEFDEDTPGARQYRDYVVRAINADLPYDDYLREHIAGDLLESPRRHIALDWNESVVGTGFWHLGEWVHSPVDARKDQCDRFDNMVDVFSKSFLGLTVACARCHDHKFDAISSKDYYALYGFLQSSHYRMARFESQFSEDRAAEKLHKVRSRYQKELSTQLQALLIEIRNSSALTDKLPKSIPSIASKALPVQASDPRLKFDATNPEMRWISDGHALGDRPARTGELQFDWRSTPSMVTVQGLQAIRRDPFWNPMQSSTEATNRQNRYPQINEAGKTFFTPTFVLDGKELSYLIRGGVRAFVAVDAHRLIAGPLHGETLRDFPDDHTNEYRWVTHGLDRYPNKNIHVEFSPIEGQPFEVVQVIIGPPPATQANEQQPLMEWRDALSALANWISNPSESSNGDRIKNASLCNFMVAQLEPLFANESFVQKWKATIENWKKEESEIASGVQWNSQLAMAMIDGSGENDSLLVRGNHLNPSVKVPRRNLEAFGGSDRIVESQGSGRLQLAEELISKNNPLVARVAVNRLWHHLTGRGIVPTTDDFGHLGLPPTHPELLDYLASQLIENDWSIKEMIREIVMSETYRRSSVATPDSMTRDPSNQWLSHARVRRLESEAIRDTLLAVTNQIDLQIGGPSVPVHLTDFLQGRGRPGTSGPMDSAGRRSIYIAVRRNFLVPMLTTFDTPVPFSSMGRRNVSNVPAQSLILLNDPFVHELASRWGKEVSQWPIDDSQKIERMYRTTLSRLPSPTELQTALAFIQGTSEGNDGSNNGSGGTQAKSIEPPEVRWSELAHVLFNTKELIFRF